MIPLVSVIVPNYNHEKYLQLRIDTVLSQTLQDFELILLDDCSTDNSRLIINKYQHHPKVSHIVYNEQNGGSAFKQWQKGINLAKGKYIWIAESDDFCDNFFLEKMVEIFANSPVNTGLTYCKSVPVAHDNRVYDESDWWMKRVDPVRWENNFVNDGKNEVSHYLAVQCTIPNVSAVLFNAHCFSDIEWGKIDFKICGDWYIYVSILKKYNIAYTALPMNYHRNHQDNVRSAHAKRAIIEQYKVLDYISKNFIVNKSTAFMKSLDERLYLLVSLVKNRIISKKEFLSTLMKMHSYDSGYILRLISVLYAKIRRVDLNFK